MIRERVVKQGELTSECWLVQIWGLTACETCKSRDTSQCGGPEIRESGTNEKGYEVPLGKEVIHEHKV